MLLNNAVYSKLIELCADICRRNGKSKLLWLDSKEKALNYTPKADEMVLTVHRWFANKACPGDWLYNRLGDLAARVTNMLNHKKEDTEMVETINITVNDKHIKADAIVKDGRTFLNLRSLENAGFKVGYNANTKMRSLDNEKKCVSLILQDKRSADYIREGKVNAVNIDGYNYMPVRDVCAVMGGTNIEYDKERGKIIVQR